MSKVFWVSIPWPSKMKNFIPPIFFFIFYYPNNFPLLCIIFKFCIHNFVNSKPFSSLSGTAFGEGNFFLSFNPKIIELKSKSFPFKIYYSEKRKKKGLNWIFIVARSIFMNLWRTFSPLPGLDAYDACNKWPSW